MPDQADDPDQVVIDMALAKASEPVARRFARAVGVPLNELRMYARLRLRAVAGQKHRRLTGELTRESVMAGAVLLEAKAAGTVRRAKSSPAPTLAHRQGPPPKAAKVIALEAEAARLEALAAGAVADPVMANGYKIRAARVRAQIPLTAAAKAAEADELERVAAGLDNTQHATAQVLRDKAATLRRTP